MVLALGCQIMAGSLKDLTIDQCLKEVSVCVILLFKQI